MATFDPAPYDKYAADPDEAVRLDRDMHRRLKAGLVGTFPASDPVSITQPPPTRHDVSPKSLWQRLTNWLG